MAKIRNLFGNIWRGRQECRVYQGHQTGNIIREYNDDKKQFSPLQREQQQRFSEFVRWWNSLDGDTKRFMNQSFYEKKLNIEYPNVANLYTYLTGLALVPPTCELMDYETFTYQIKHPAIQRIELRDKDDNIIVAYSDLSDLESLEFTTKYEVHITFNTSKIVLYSCFNQSYEFKIMPEVRYMTTDYIKIYENTFTTEITQFTVENIPETKQLYMSFFFDMRTQSSGNNAIAVYPNGDTGTNYKNIMFYFDENGHYVNVDFPSAIMTLCTTGWGRRCISDGEATLYTLPTDTWKRLYSRFILTPTDQYVHALTDFIAYWKNTTSQITSLLFKTIQPGYGFTGWIKIYALQE